MEGKNSDFFNDVVGYRNVAMTADKRSAKIFVCVDVVNKATDERHLTSETLKIGANYVIFAAVGVTTSQNGIFVVAFFEVYPAIADKKYLGTALCLDRSLYLRSLKSYGIDSAQNSHVVRSDAVIYFLFDNSGKIKYVVL